LGLAPLSQQRRRLGCIVLTTQDAKTEILIEVFLPMLNSAVCTKLKFIVGVAVFLPCASLLIPASEGPCANQEANQLLQRGRDTFPKGGYGAPPTVAAAGRALTYFDLAVEKDPACAQAHVAQAQAYADFPSWPGVPPAERFVKVQSAAAKAIELQGNLAPAHLLLALAEFNTGQWAQAEKEFKRAIQLAPSDAPAHASYARYLAAMGHFDEAIAEMEQARKLAGGTPRFSLAAGEIYYWARRYDRAIELIRPAVDASPIGNFLLGWAYVGKSEWDEAIRAFEKELPLADRDAGALMSLAYAYAAAGRRSEVPKLLEEAKEKTNRMYVPVYRIAAVYVALSDKDQAIEWLEKAYHDDFGWMVWLKVDPVMAPLRSEPRFQDLLRRMNFPSELK